MVGQVLLYRHLLSHVHTCPNPSWQGLPGWHETQVPLLPSSFPFTTWHHGKGVPAQSLSLRQGIAGKPTFPHKLLFYLETAYKFVFFYYAPPVVPGFLGCMTLAQSLKLPFSLKMHSSLSPLQSGIFFKKICMLSQSWKLST